ncbi:MAG: hypothetical protein MJZ70_04155 [Bacteroidales bacterium]|nr:hypothetical protein [Bacteroidales bacterium]
MKNRNSIKGEYNVGYSIGSTGVRDFQELLNRRNSQLAAQMETNDDEHRMEFVKTFRGVDFINDAACENANGIYMALSNMTKQVTWITSFNQWDKIDVDLLQMIIRKVNAIVYYGTEDEQTHSFIDALSIRNEQSEDLETAVRIAFYASEQGDAVLFCPATSAEDCAERGCEFKTSVAQL